MFDFFVIVLMVCCIFLWPCVDLIIEQASNLRRRGR